MSANDRYSKITLALRLLICQLIFAFCSMALIMPNVIARGNHNGGHHIDSGPLGEHSRHFGGHGHIVRGHRHLGDERRHFGSDYGQFRGGRKNFNVGHSRYGDSFHRGYHRGHGYYPHGYAYSPVYYAPRVYSFSYPSYLLYRSQYASSAPSVGGYQYPQKYIGREGAYSYNSASVRYPDIATGNSYSTNDLGWRLLAQNNPREALDVFTTQVAQRPKDGVSKVGYALSAAMLNDLNKAAWTMRRAFRIDPDSLHYLKIDTLLRTSIDTLLVEYHNQLNYAQGNRHFDVAFMIAALNYLIHEKDAARVAIEESVDKLGDNSPSAINLQRLVINNEY